MGALLTKMYARWLVAVDTRPPKCPDLIDFRAPKTLAQPMNDTYPNTLSAHAPNGAVFVSQPPVWQVGGLMRALADAVSARFNPVRVQGEVSGFARAASGHCYFTLKDADAQVRCALFRRAASGVAVLPRDGDRVEVGGKLDIYGPRGDLQLIVDTLAPAGQGVLFERFMRLKAQLASEGLFDAGRKRPVPAMPQAVGVVTSLGAAALRDVATALQRRVPHVPVTVFPAAVQGAQAPGELCLALDTAYRQFAATGSPQVLLLVRGGGSLEDLWAFNDEQLARTLARAPMPVISGVGHETDFTIADFVSDLRAPTPTAAAELCATDRLALQGMLAALESRAQAGLQRHIDTQAQRLDRLAQRMARPSDRVARQQQQLLVYGHRLQRGLTENWKQQSQYIKAVEADLSLKTEHYLSHQARVLAGQEAVLTSMDPRLVLNRGYAWLTTANGHPLASAHTTHPGQALTATLADGEVELTVR